MSMPPSVQEWLPEDHWTRFGVNIVEQLDIRAINGKYNKQA
jgi:hypothetical protein